ncbi:short-chain dehydrogenase [Paractinoplanes abujensis]|uniref:NAD(P)-dependent dehydrogenase (Short-subunit alcohol dehydrogenase family) n=1 Tax=Paractinoplanes abujensis TaxID=882441 RepID=A0A7W7CSZ7_9ACTN|nr:SDR family NAD(P)-dependent oxidoreductase [Actinoplanes abujensis]MBB4694109.1 NAD(P)-dependent dehydrogenase (short-subunit alcohol dehydrogenase family) [Actinoplanes abujensis]GID20676.1 short-chain dehydrogenase [Actinoplanes abujensis]
MSKWTAQSMRDMSGKTVVVTGGSRGIGRIAARELARAGARVVVAARTVEPGPYETRKLDVSDLGSVRAFAQEWTGDLDVLINNAGVMAIPGTRTADGLDLQTATNYFGPWLLTHLLLPHITDRVVHVTSQLHRQAKLDLDDLDWRRRTYKPLPAYEASKLAQVLFSLSLQRRLDAKGSRVRSVLAHPGIARTGLVGHSWMDVVNRIPFLTHDAEGGALPLLYAASEDVPGNAYVGPDGLWSIKGFPTVRRPARAGLDERAAERLWTATEALVLRA